MKCVLCIPTRNTARFLDVIFRNIYTLKSSFSEFIVCFFYDTSSDNTLSKLQSFQAEFGVDKCIILINDEPLLHFRTHRIAHARNKLVEFIRVSHPDSEYFIMMDSDDVCSFQIDSNVLNEHLLMDNWDSLSFNRSGLTKEFENYDIWALQFEPFIHHCHGYGADHTGYSDVSLVGIMRDSITTILNNLKDGELFECYSAFNGIAVYRTPKFLDVLYDGVTQKYFSDEELDKMLVLFKERYGKEVTIKSEVHPDHGGGPQNCEHIGFHINAIRKNNARIMISGKKIFF